jgi:hypothetical protein
MKTSNKLIISATLIIIGYLVAYDFALKAEYVKGTYKSRFYQMKQLSFKNFNAIEHNAANNINLRVEQGPGFGVWVDERLKDKIIIRQHKQTLSIYYNSKDNYRRYAIDHDIIIICPYINSIITNAHFYADTVKTATGIQTTMSHPDFGTPTTITGFKSTMSIQANTFTKIEMYNNNLPALNALVNGNNAVLKIDTTNIIKVATIQTSGESVLSLLNPAIETLHYNIADSTELTLSGKSFRQIRH